MLILLGDYYRMVPVLEKVACCRSFTREPDRKSIARPTTIDLPFGSTNSSISFGRPVSISARISVFRG